MKLKTGIAGIGATAGIGAIAGLYFGIGLGWIFLAVVVVLGILSYILAAVGANSRTSTTGFGEFMRGWLLGMNAGLNGFLAFALFELAALEAGLIVGIALGLINLLSIFGPISQNEIWQGFVGWFNWLMPMSWLVVGLGFIFYLLCFLLHLVTTGKVNYLKVQDTAMDWKTGTFFIKGGLISNLNPIDTAFNMGNFSFVDYKSGAWHKEHEAGHTLNLGAFGSIFHLIGALDENAIPHRGANAFAERIAESNDTGTSGSNIPMWA